MARGDRRTFTQALDAQPVRLRQWAIVAVCMLVLVAEGMDLQLLGILAPVVMEAFDVTRSTFGIAMSAALVGFGLGAFSGGLMGDRIGRRWTLVIASVVFSLATVGASTSTDVWTMAVWRAVSGLGFGAAYANALSMANEWLPVKWRPVAVSTLAVGTPLGGSLVGEFAPGLSLEYGWDGTFLILGGITFLVTFVVWAVLRDSPSFLLARGEPEKARKNARLVLDEDEELAAEEDDSADATGRKIGLTHPTTFRLSIGIAIAFAAATFVAYGILSWGTTFLTAQDFTLEEAGGVVALAGYSSMVGSILAGVFVRRFGSKIVMATLSAVLVMWMLAIGYTVEGLPPVLSPEEKTFVFWLVGLSGSCFSAAIAAMYVIMAFGYPQAVRAAGMGLGILMSRVGAISATGFGGALLEAGGDSTWLFFGALTAAAVLIMAAAFVVDRHVPPLARAG
ncbi:MFS transporter [Aurantiacibacter poecillastricola]|uniref:MFS transporter n=1 Tax=Aurantiacibacter poecillastricola TaxID=3064385 RepID=UPI00273D7FE2|nr:MFS transporter [Aurantiacibacter sp. 219JJ12-13]MDP5263005.1 MFS transporter [Aurantiacibacter sp. 219JJ12-13]